MLEKDIESKVCSYAKARGLVPYKFTSPNRRSVPDRLFLGPGDLCFFIEFKAPGKEPTSAQEREIERISRIGHRVYVIDSIETGKRAINFETTGDASWLSDQSGGFQPVQRPDDAVVGHGPGEDGGSPDKHS